MKCFMKTPLMRGQTKTMIIPLNLKLFYVSTPLSVAVAYHIFLIFSHTNIDYDYPVEFKAFIDKQILFKVEVSEGNVSRRYGNFAVKKATNDAGVIDEFMSKNNLKMCDLIST